MTKLPNSSVNSFARQACALEESVAEEVQPGDWTPSNCHNVLDYKQRDVRGTLQPWL